MPLGKRKRTNGFAPIQKRRKFAGTARRRTFKSARSRNYRVRSGGSYTASGAMRRARPLAGAPIYKPLGLASPPRLVVKHRWAMPITLSPGGSSDSKLFRMDNIFDPEVSVAANVSASYYEELTADYDKYTVLGARLRVWYINPRSDVAQIGESVGIGGMLFDNLKAQVAPTEAHLAYMDRRYKYMGTLTSEKVSRRKPVMTINYSAKKANPGRNLLENVRGMDPDAATEVWLGPAQQTGVNTYSRWEAEVRAFNILSTGTGEVSEFFITIDYTVLWHQPKTDLGRETAVAS